MGAGGFDRRPCAGTCAGSAFTHCSAVGGLKECESLPRRLSMYGADGLGLPRKQNACTFVLLSDRSAGLSRGLLVLSTPVESVELVMCNDGNDRCTLRYKSALCVLYGPS